MPEASDAGAARFVRAAWVTRVTPSRRGARVRVTRIAGVARISGRRRPGPPSRRRAFRYTGARIARSTSPSGADSGPSHSGHPSHSDIRVTQDTRVNRACHWQNGPPVAASHGSAPEAARSSAALRRSDSPPAARAAQAVGRRITRIPTVRIGVQIRQDSEAPTWRALGYQLATSALVAGPTGGRIPRSARPSRARPTIASGGPRDFSGRAVDVSGGPESLSLLSTLSFTRVRDFFFLLFKLTVGSKSKARRGWLSPPTRSIA